MDPAADEAAAAASRAKAERMLVLAKKLGVNADDPAMAFGFMLGCASSTTFRLKQQHIVLHMIPHFPPCIVVWALLEYLGVSYQGTVAFTKSALELRHPGFLTQFPAHTIPAIQHGATVIHETIAITAYVCKLFPVQARRKLAGTVHPEDVFAVEDATKDIRRVVQGGGRFMWDLMGFTGRPWSKVKHGYIRCREGIVTFFNHRRRVLLEAAALAGRSGSGGKGGDGGGGGADAQTAEPPFLFGDRPSLADITLATFLRVLRVGNLLSGFPWDIQQYAARCTRVFRLHELEDGRANGFGSGLLDVVSRRSAELGDIEVPPYVPPAAATPGVLGTGGDGDGGGSGDGGGGGDGDGGAAAAAAGGAHSPGSQGASTPVLRATRKRGAAAPGPGEGERETGGAEEQGIGAPATAAPPVAVHTTDSSASLGAE